MNVAKANSHHPDLGVGNALAQFVACFQLIGIEGKLATFDVNRCKLALVIRLKLGADILLVNGVPTSSELFFAVPALGGCHDPPSLIPARSQSLPSSSAGFSSGGAAVGSFISPGT